MNKISFIFITFILFLSLALGSAGSVGAEGFVFTRNLTLGARGNDVLALQQFLIAGDFLKINIPTDYFGPLTRAALSRWQASLGIYPSAGFFGPISREKIKKAPEKVAPQAPIEVAPVNSAVAAATTSIATTRNADGSPLRIKIPKINVDAGFQYNGLNPDGSMEIPSNIVDVGWFTGSVHPGERGVAVVTGHVAQIRGGVLTKPGVFYDLNQLRVGDKISVLNDKGVSVTFVVRESRNYDPSADSTDVFTASDNGAHLNIITCEGTWNPGQLSYSQRLVIFTDAIY